MNNRNTFASLAAVPLLLLAPTMGALAQTVNWGTTWTTAPALIDSTGAAQDSSFIWEIGWFDSIGGWEATATNFLEWETHWHPVGDSKTPEANFGYHYVEGSVTPTAADQGNQVYILAHNGWFNIGTSDGEALLYTRTNLFFPDPESFGSSSFNIEDLPGTPNDDNANFEVIFGRVDRDINTVNPSALVSGGGHFSYEPGDSSAGENSAFEAQTGRFVPIPEPTALLLTAMAGLAGVLRRRRNA